MNLRSLAGVAASAAIVAAPFVGAPAAHAATSHDTSGEWTFSAKLDPLNGSGAHSMVWGKLTGDKLWLKITSQGLAAGLPHAQHIHIGGGGSCPNPNEKGTGQDGHLLVSDAMKYYGMIGASLTATGDTTPASGLAVDRFQTGDTTYERTITLDAKTLADVKAGKAVIVQHGVDYNHNGKFDGPGKSDLDPNLPEEATDPATCGVLMKSQMNDMPGGGVQTGMGEHNDASDLAVVGGSVLTLGGVAGVLAARRRRSVNA